jgi:hypothetical protein
MGFRESVRYDFGWIHLDQDEYGTRLLGNKQYFKHFY